MGTPVHIQGSGVGLSRPSLLYAWLGLPLAHLHPQWFAPTSCTASLQFPAQSGAKSSSTFHF